MRRLLIIPLVMGILLVGAMAWSGGGLGSEVDFTFINRGENKSLDPNGMSWLQDIRIAYGLWEGLYTLDSQTLRPIPGSADKIDISASQTIYTFHLRLNTKWSNGDPLKSQDFLFSWRRMLEQPGDYTYLFYYIQGAKEYESDYTAWSKDSSLKRPDFDFVGIKAIDDSTLRVTLKHPVTFFPALCAFPSFFPLHEPSMRRFAQTDPATDRVLSYDQAFTRPPNLVTNGPYRLAEWSFKRRLRLVASDYYWDRANVKSHIIDQVYAEDPLAAFRIYNSGAVDWLADVDGDITGELLDKGGRADLHIFPGFGTYFYTINCQPKLPDGRSNPLADVRVRRALAMALDKRPIVDNIMRMGQPIATTFIPPGIFAGYPSPAGFAPNLDKARNLLTEAGYPGGKDFPHLTILFNSEGNHGQIAQVIRRQWAENLGIDMELEGVEIKIFGARLHEKDYAIGRASWIGDYDDPSTFTDKYKSESDNNDCGWTNKQYDSLCAAAEIETDPSKRMQILSQAEKLLLDEAPIIPIYHYVNAYMFRSTVTGVSLDPKNMVMLKSLEATH